MKFCISGEVLYRKTPLYDTMFGYPNFSGQEVINNENKTWWNKNK